MIVPTLTVNRKEWRNFTIFIFISSSNLQQQNPSNDSYIHFPNYSSLICFSPYIKKLILLQDILTLRKMLEIKRIMVLPLNSGFRLAIWVWALVWEWLIAAKKHFWPLNILSFACVNYLLMFVERTVLTWNAAVS